MTHTALEGEFLVGVPLGLILGLLLFNIFICDMFKWLQTRLSQLTRIFPSKSILPACVKRQVKY